MQKLSLTKTVGPNDPTTACNFLAEFTALSKSRVKDAMLKGAVWLKKQKGKQHRIRRATAGLRPGDVLSIYYDSDLLSKFPPLSELISDQGRYSVWLKPAGLMSQGTKYGDHCSLLRQAALYFKSRRKVYLIHRLDREAAGLDLLSRSLYSDYFTVMDFYLRRNDINRAFGLETRYPMLDHDLVEYCARIPTSLKIRGWFDTKYILKKSMESVLPRKIVYREDKLGHSIPLKNWLRDKPVVKDFVLDHLSDSTISKRGWFKPGYINQLIRGLA